MNCNHFMQPSGNSPLSLMFLTWMFELLQKRGYKMAYCMKCNKTYFLHPLEVEKEQQLKETKMHLQFDPSI